MYKYVHSGSALHSGPVPKQFHHLKGPWARWLSPPTSSPEKQLCCSQCTAHVPPLRGWAGGDGAGRVFLPCHPPTVARHVRSPGYPSRSGPCSHQVSSTCSGQSHASDAYSSSDHRAVRGGGWVSPPWPTVAHRVEPEGTA